MLKLFLFIQENQATPPAYSHLIDLRLYTTKHIHVLKYQLLTFVNNILFADFFVRMVINISSISISCLSFSFHRLKMV